MLPKQLSLSGLKQANLKSGWYYRPAMPTRRFGGGVQEHLNFEAILFFTGRLFLKESGKK